MTRTKYPRTFHFPWSEGLTDDDKMLSSLDGFLGEEVVVTEKMDGENTTLYRDFYHARSLDSGGTTNPVLREARTWIKRFQGLVGADIPVGLRVCGENLFAQHSIPYVDLPSYFLAFSIWQDELALSWDETVEWCALLGIEMVPVLYRGPFDDEIIRALHQPVRGLNESEGYVVRPTRAFTLGEFDRVVGKYVRKGHVITGDHWAHSKVIRNQLRG